MRTVKRSFVNRSFFSSRCKGRLIFYWWNYSDKNWYCKMNNYSGGEWQFWQFLRVKNKKPRLITMGWMKKKKERRRKKRKRQAEKSVDLWAKPHHCQRCSEGRSGIIPSRTPRVPREIHPAGFALVLDIKGEERRSKPVVERFFTKLDGHLKREKERERLIRMSIFRLSIERIIGSVGFSIFSTSCRPCKQFSSNDSTKQVENMKIVGTSET